MVMMETLVSLSVAYVLGVLSVLVVEVAALFFLIRRLKRRVALEQQKINESSSPELDPSIYNKQGVVWILESEKVVKARQDSQPREQKLKKEILEVLPVQKYAKLKNNSLFISESDGSQTEVELKGCTVTAVSATNFSSRKWGKRYPIKVESKNSKIYKGSKILYIYLDTSWEKEAWCKVLRLASCDDKEKLKWFTDLNLDFQRYVTSLNAEYPSFMKPSIGWSVDPIDKSIKLDGSSSKVRQFLKKLGKKASKSGVDSKGIWTNASIPEDRKINEKFGPTNMGTKGKVFSEDISVQSPLSTSSGSGSRSQTSVVSDLDSDERTFDEGTLCWNILLSRLFFDAKCNVLLKSSMQARIQRMLSNMRSPSFIGEVTCTAVDPGNLPPYIHAMRVLPAHMNELWAFEIDLEYSGDAFLNVETRLEVQELDLQEGEGTALESSGVGEVASDLLEGIEYYGKQLNVSEEGADELVQRDEGEPGLNGERSHKGTIQGPSQMSRWKCMLQSIAKQVSQVPISLRIRVSSLRGTMRVYMKAPPSDQIWFGFSSMPDIDFNLEPLVGDRKITSGHLALFLISRFKVAIRETLVLPNCESICIPWMLAEKDDWVPQRVAPFIWIKNEATASAIATTTAAAKQGSSSQSVEEKFAGEPNKGASNSSSGDRQQKTNKAAGHVIQLENEPSEEHPLSSAPMTQLTTSTDCSSNQLTTPLLGNDKQDEKVQSTTDDKVEHGSLSQAIVTGQQKYNAEDDDDGRPKRIGTRARVLGFGKKMGEKLEEKRKHIEERGRHIVERMKEHRQNSGVSQIDVNRENFRGI